ncbi:hypothetical protein [Actinokineospora sp. UTMC 2448]|uniref:hypothetical protein n=1 Tax=Actinokineospora sp. UTMC 2448 TaxID=2268449 RepID=UPI002164067D|nr:hypothetical protein [Actinokineospora sp. UTMC 2448]UVS82176.1 hypothetical protein Actkin_05941 [Actinokineospora sp. UTMC 2448]
MDLFSAPALLIEQDIGMRKSFFNTSFAVNAYDEGGRLLARVRDRKSPGLLGAVRMLGEAGTTPYDLAVTLPDGREALRISKGFTWLGAGRVGVADPHGREVGTMVRRMAGSIEFADPDGRPLGAFGDHAAFRYGEVAKRDGQRVRRNTLWPRPEAQGPARLLAIAAGLAYTVVSGMGNKA